MLPDKLKMHSDAQLVADMHRYLFANIDRTGKLPSFCLPHLSGSSLAISGLKMYNRCLYLFLIVSVLQIRPYAILDLVGCQRQTLSKLIQFSKAEAGLRKLWGAALHLVHQ